MNYMSAIISFIFIFVIVAELENGDITTGQAIFCTIYGLIMFYHTSKKYWDYDKYQKSKKRGR